MGKDSLKILETQIEQLRKEFHTKTASEVPNSLVGQCKEVYANDEVPSENASSNATNEVSFIANNEAQVTQEEDDVPTKVLPCQLPPKELNPGSFTLPCTIGSLNSYAMADLGIVENVLVKIDKFLFPSDFMVIDMLNTRNETMILGRPFLATIHAKIDVFNIKISLGTRNDRVTFDMDKRIHNFATHVGNIYMVNSIHNDELMRLSVPSTRPCSCQISQRKDLIYDESGHHKNAKPPSEKNLLIENKNLIVNCLSTQLLYDVKKSRCLDLEADMFKVHDESKLISKLEREYLDSGKLHVSLAGPNPEHMDDEFLATAYPKVHENLKLITDERVIDDKPESHSGSMSSMKNLDDTFNFGDQFLYDKPTEDDQDKSNVREESESTILDPDQTVTSTPPVIAPFTDVSSSKPSLLVTPPPINTEATTITTSLPEITPIQQPFTKSGKIRSRNGLNPLGGHQSDEIDEELPLSISKLKAALIPRLPALRIRSIMRVVRKGNKTSVRSMASLNVGLGEGILYQQTYVSLPDREADQISDAKFQC
ncbi:putative ribonuclease H-like domain-containing protein [Tanacetum coccineum]